MGVASKLLYLIQKSLIFRTFDATPVMGARGLVASGPTPGMGLQWAIALAILLATHQLAMIAQAKLYRMRQFPNVYRVLSIATGRRPWRTSRES